MTTTIPHPALLEDVWQSAPPGREACALNELLRALRALIEPRPPRPRFIERR
jgi:hypothetical protein